MSYKQHETSPLEAPIGRRFVIWGRPGKTTLGKAIAQKHGLNFIEVDWITHMPGWGERPLEQSQAIVRKRVSESDRGWVFDGDPRPFSDSTLANTDSVILVDLPWLTTFWTYLKRGIRRSWDGREIAGGNRETFRLNFLSRDSHLWHVIKTRRRDYRALLDPVVPDGATYFVINSWKELNRFYEIHDLPRNPSIDSREAASSWLE